MGQIAAEHADVVYVTDEENDKEDRAAIRADIMEGIKKSAVGKAMVTEVPDRRVAIKLALEGARKGDIVLLAGMGHEVYRLLDGERIGWNDAEVAREAWGELGSSQKTV